jgi:hypothetical protein
MTNSTDIARAMADTMAHAAIPMYGKKLRLPDRSAIISLIKELRRLFFPAYFGDPQLMALPAENYAALLLERIETALTTQIALALPEEESSQASRITQSIVAELPRIQQVLLTDIEATFDGDPAAESILSIAADGSWELYERPGGDGDPARVDGGTLREGGEAGVYYADSTDFDGVTYDMQAVDEDVLYWGGEYDCYQRGQ